MKTSRLIVTTVAIAGLSPVAEADIANALHQGRECTVLFEDNKLKFDHKGKQYSDCDGTLATTVPYLVQYIAEDGEYEVKGYICDSGRNQTHRDPGPSPLDGYFNMWNHPLGFSFDAAGNVTYKGQNEIIGSIRCPGD